MTSIPPPRQPDPRAVLRDLLAVVAVVLGLLVIVVGAFNVHPGLGWMTVGASVAAGGYLLGRN